MKPMGSIILVMGLFVFAQVTQAQWTPAKRITWNSGNAEYPAIAVDSLGALHVVWQDDTPGKAEIYYKRSEDGGPTWSAAKRLTWTSGDSYASSIAIDSHNGIHVVWYDDTTGNNEIYYKTSADGGTTWSATKRITWTSGWSEGPAMAIDSDNTIHIVWDDYTQPGKYEILFKKSTDGGTTWSAAKRLATSPIEAGFTAVATDSSKAIHVVWYDYTPDNEEIYYRRSADGGTTWSTVKRLTWTSGRSAFPCIAIDPGNRVHIVWNDDTSSIPEIYYRRSPDGGATWSAAKRLTWSPRNSLFPVIAIDPGNCIHVVWEDDIPGTPEIYHKRSTDGGGTWSGAKRLTWTSGLSYDPAMAIDSNTMIHIVWDWQENMFDNYKIFYMRGK